MVGYHQTNQKTDTGKTLTRWPVLVDHNIQTKPALRIKTKHQIITSRKPKTRKIPKWCIDRIPSDAQIIGETELHYLVRH
ncbi:hypothetical protein E2K63_25070 [Escherichia coli]|nr:hypothetical protein E2K71_24895 [Escherichia coli]KAA0652810.1 hypothetical protein E2K63_25070 [Escherichia coli]